MEEIDELLVRGRQFLPANPRIELDRLPVGRMDERTEPAFAVLSPGAIRCTSPDEMIEGEVEFGDDRIEGADRWFRQATFDLGDHAGRQTQSPRQLALRDAGLDPLLTKAIPDPVEVAVQVLFLISTHINIQPPST